MNWENFSFLLCLNIILLMFTMYVPGGQLCLKHVL